MNAGVGSRGVSHYLRAGAYAGVCPHIIIECFIIIFIIG